MRLPGAIWFGSVPMPPSRSVTPGNQLKSIISLLSRKPAPLTTMPRAVAALQRVGVAHRHAVVVDDREVRRAVALAPSAGCPWPGPRCGVALLRVDACGQLLGVLLASSGGRGS